MISFAQCRLISLIFKQKTSIKYVFHHDFFLFRTINNSKEYINKIQTLNQALNEYHFKS